MLIENGYSVLVVTCGEKMTDALNDLLSPNLFSTKDFVSDVSGARRKILDREYDCLIINTPLKDEFGIDFALDTAADSNTGILLLVKSEIYDEVVDKTDTAGILTVSKPTSKTVIKQSLNLLLATRERIRKIEKKNRSFEEKMKEIKAVNHAKWLLIENEGLNEAEAHKFIEKEAMNKRLTRMELASSIIAKYEGGR
ncbi:MAG: ANTAR domain-containing protein [Clostridiales bacterium]|nr:ANTAR domain-containing protein [Clostridiales bacterium]